jgi:serine/threonine protein kinase
MDKQVKPSGKVKSRSSAQPDVLKPDKLQPGPLDEPIAFGRYTLVERIATGGMAEIFKALAHGTHAFQKTIVVKRMLPHLAKVQEFVDMFIDEARVMGCINHPRIVQVFDFGQVDDQLFMAMEHVDGADLLTLLQSCARNRRRPPTAIAVHIMCEVLDALDYTHQLIDEQGLPLDVVHRDVSPSNIFVSRRGDVKLGDFGIAFMSGRRAQTQIGVLKGKYSYMSPEQVAGKPIDQRRDVFAAGVVLAELLMVRRLFMADNELEVLLQVRDARLERLDRFGAHIPEALRAILDAALSRNPETRYQTAAAFQRALLHYLHESQRLSTNSSVRRFMKRLGLLEDKAEEPALDLRVTAKGRSREEPFESDQEPPLLDRSGEILVEELPREIRNDVPSQTPTDKRLAPPLAETPLAETPSKETPSKETPSKEAPSKEAPSVERADEPAQPAVTIDSPAVPVDLANPDGAIQHVPSAILPATRDLSPAAAAKLQQAMSSGTGVLGAIRIGIKRPIALRPPTSPDLPKTTGEEPRLSTEDALAALPELERQSSSRITAGSLDPPPPEQLSLVPDPSQVLAVRLSQTRPLPSANLESQLTRVSLFCVLFELARREETGLLLLERDDVSKRLYLVDGHPEVVVSNQPADLFGQFLVKENLVTAGELSMGLAMLPHFDGRLGDALVGLGLLTPMEVLRHLTMLEREKVLELFRWREGKVSYHRGEQKGEDAAPIGLDSFEFLGVAASKMPMERVRSSLQPLMELELERVNPPPVPPEAFQMGPRPREIWRAFHDRVALEAHFARTGEPDDDTLRAVYLLWETGLIAGYDETGRITPCEMFDLAD